MSHLELALVLVALALVLLTGARVLPGFLLMIRPAMLRTWFADAEQEARCLSASPALEDCLQRLKAQHFFLLGIKTEKLPLWGREYREVALAARDHSAFASIVLLPFGAPSSVYLYTPLRGGGMVFTRDYAAGRQIEGHWLSVRNVPTEDLELLVREHHGRVEAMLARGAVSDLRSTQAGRLEATRAFYASEYSRRTAMRLLLPGLVTCGLSLALLLWAIVAPLLD